MLQKYTVTQKDGSRKREFTPEETKDYKLALKGLKKFVNGELINEKEYNAINSLMIKVEWCHEAMDIDGSDNWGEW